jgi:hypothetical protein
MTTKTKSPLQHISDEIAKRALNSLVSHAHVEILLKERSSEDLEKHLAECFLELLDSNDQLALATALAQQLVININRDAELEREIKELKEKPERDGYKAHPGYEKAKDIAWSIVEQAKESAEKEGAEPKRLDTIESCLPFIKKCLSIIGYKDLPDDDTEAVYRIGGWLKPYWPDKRGRPKKSG